MSKPVGPYTPIVRGGDLLFTAGQVGIADGAIVEGGLEAELRQVFVNLRSVLSSADASLTDVVKTTVFGSNPAARICARARRAPDRSPAITCALSRHEKE